jgi:hypothetical protein
MENEVSRRIARAFREHQGDPEFQEPSRADVAAQVNEAAEAMTARQGNPPRINSPTWSEQEHEYSKTGGTKGNPFRP